MVVVLVAEKGLALLEVVVGRVLVRGGRVAER